MARKISIVLAAAPTKVKKVTKKAVNKLLDTTELDETLVSRYNKNKKTIDTIVCYTKCYGGYILAIGAGCTFGNGWTGISLLIAAAGWAYWQTCKCKPCKGSKCCA